MGILEVSYSGGGFVKTAEGEFFVPESKIGPAFNGDLVELAPLPSERSAGKNSGNSSRLHRAARVVRVVNRAHEHVVGRYEIAEPFGVVVPEDPRIHHDIFTMRADNPDILDGSLVKVRMVTYPDKRSAATGIIEEVLGQEGDPSIDIDLVIARHKLETAFSDGSLEQASKAQVDVEGALASGYRDLRERFVFTVDPEDAKDFDDAVSLDRVEGRDSAVWRLGVHIADVSHYVEWGSSIDLDARRRATSVYLPDRVIPMLPPRLSDDLCSLRPHETRRAFTVDLYLDATSRVVESDPYPSLICSSARLTYGQALQLMEGECQLSVADCDEGALTDRLMALSEIAKQRALARQLRGGMDFDSPEVKVALDDFGNPTGYSFRCKTLATQLIEESMIMANEAVARRLSQAKMPAIYRVHEQPDSQNLEALVPVFQEFDWFRQIDDYSFVMGDPLTLSSALARSKGRPESDLVSSLLLRSMKRAVYRPECEGHYGLASAAYCHFTSPIRRYPDLVVHRMLKALLGFKVAERAAGDRSLVESLPWLSEHSSDMERIAEKASQEALECKMLQLMESQVGQAFQGVVSGVMTYGFYVRLDNTLEGLVLAEGLGNEFYSFNPVRHALTGSDTGVEYRLGQTVTVRVKSVDRRARLMELQLVR